MSFVLAFLQVCRSQLTILIAIQLYRHQQLLHAESKALQDISHVLNLDIPLIMRLSTIFAMAAGLIASVAAISPVSIKGSKFFTSDGAQFYIKG